MAKAVTKIRGRFADERYTGSEPTLTANSTVTDEINLYNWYNYYHSNDDAKSFTLAYLKSIKFDKTKVRKLAVVPAVSLRNVGWLCRCLMHGGELPSRLEKRLWSQIDMLLTHAPEPVDESPEIDDTTQVETVEQKVVSIRERTVAKADNLIADIEDFLDSYYREGKTFDAVKWFRDKDVKPQLAQHIAEYYKPLYSEIFDAQSGRDPQLVEAYSRWKKPKLKAYLEFVRSIVAAAEDRQIIAKAIRKPRKKKAKPASVLVGKLQYLEQDAELNIKSVKPTEVVGAQQLWVYNVKYKTLAVYNAMGPAGLSVKGTTLTGFDEKTSLVKKLRKPKEQLQALADAGKVNLRKFMDTVKCKPKEATSRLNKSTVLFRVGK